MRLSFKTKRGKIYFEIYIYRSSDPFNEQKLLLDYLDKEAEQIGRNSNIHEFRPRFPDVRDKLQITTKRHAISFSPSPPPFHLLRSLQLQTFVLPPFFSFIILRAILIKPSYAPFQKGASRTRERAHIGERFYRWTAIFCRKKLAKERDAKLSLFPRKSTTRKRVNERRRRTHRQLEEGEEYCELVIYEGVH